jgi:hypothetical protein
MYNVQLLIINGNTTLCEELKPFHPIHQSHHAHQRFRRESDTREIVFST